MSSNSNASIIFSCKKKRTIRIIMTYHEPQILLVFIIYSSTALPMGMFRVARTHFFVGILCRPISDQSAAVGFLEGWKFSTSTWQGFVEQTSRTKKGQFSLKMAERHWLYVHFCSCFSTFEIEVDMIRILAASTWWFFTAHNLNLRGKINISNSLVAHRSPLKHDGPLLVHVCKDIGVGRRRRHLEEPREWERC